MEFWLRVLGHLLPRAQLFSLVVERTFVRWLSGFALWLSGLKVELDSVWLEIWPSTTTRLSDHEEQFGAGLGTGTEAERRGAIAARWLLLRGGQGPDYLREVLQRAGFQVWVHEFWDPDTFAVRDPHDHVTSAQIGRVQAGNPIAYAGHSLAQASWDEVSGANYLVNKTLTSQPRPPIPDDPNEWEGFVYIGGEEFPDRATVPEARRDEFEDLVLQIFPMDKWIVLLVDFEPDFELATEDDDNLTAEDDDTLMA